MAAKKLFIQVSSAVFNALYSLFDGKTRRNEALFVSRQTNVPPDDFVAVGEELRAKGWTPRYHTRKLSKRTALRYVVHVVQEIYYLSRCRICFLDRYDPVVSLIDFTYEENADNSAVHSEYPAIPVVIQMWHAFGSFKCFGYQSLDTQEGHSAQTAELFNIHRNYSWILCTGKDDCKVYAEAFGYPEDRVLPLGRPEFDTLLNLSGRQSNDVFDGGKQTVLFAPTLRKSKESEHPFYGLREKLGDGCSSARFVWSFHPLELHRQAPAAVSSDLLCADIVVTDYSSIVYEAALLKKRVLFYVPDIEEYRKSPGLNSDPQILAPKITFTSRESLVGYLSGLISGSVEYDQTDFDAFIGETFSSCRPGVACRVAEFALAQAETHLNF